MINWIVAELIGSFVIGAGGDGIWCACGRCQRSRGWIQDPDPAVAISDPKLLVVDRQHPVGTRDVIVRCTRGGIHWAAQGTIS